MANFEVKIVQIDDVVDHPNADRLTLVRIGGYTCIANKLDDGSWRYQAGDYVAYIPENAVVPERILRTMNMWNDDKKVGVLSGKKGNRVKAIKLRKVYSEGLLLPVRKVYDDEVELEILLPAVYTEEMDWHQRNISVRPGDDVAEQLEIYKYEPQIPSSMGGDVFSMVGFPVKYDIEAIEKHLDVFKPYDVVLATEQCHGTFTAFAILPKSEARDDLFPTPDGDRRIMVYSKGLGAQGLVFKNVQSNDSNLYVQSMRSVVDGKFWLEYLKSPFANYEEVHFFGETFGPGVQDLHYGLLNKEFRLFDIYIRDRGKNINQYLSSYLLQETANALGIKTVPVLFNGKYSDLDIPKYRDGKDTISESHVRGGVVIKPLEERHDDSLGRVVLKAVSPDYKLRRGDATEYN